MARVRAGVVSGHDGGFSPSRRDAVMCTDNAGRLALPYRVGRARDRPAMKIRALLSDPANS